MGKANWIFYGDRIISHKLYWETHLPVYTDASLYGLGVSCNSETC